MNTRPSPSQMDGDLLDDPKAEGLEQRHEGRQVDLAPGLVETAPA